MKKIFILICLIIILLGLLKQYKDEIISFVRFNENKQEVEYKKQTIVQEESQIIKVVEKSLPSVVTIGIKKNTTTGGYFEIDPFDPFSFRRQPRRQQVLERNIGSGFVVSEDGLIITNRHVVADTEAKYKIMTNDKKTYDVVKVYRDNLNDLALLKVEGAKLHALQLGDSSKLKLGQITIAIGTPLGEFPNTVTTGIVSGLGRGITAGSPFESFVEKLDNVIQTDAAISPGNSGGPLLNSAGQVIGVNTAVSSQGQNIGFAIPVNVVKDLIDSFHKRGSSFERPYIGIRYQMIDKDIAIINEIPEGAYVIEVLDNSPALAAGVQVGDIITHLDDKRITGNNEKSLASIIAQMKIGDQVKLKIWREQKQIELSVILGNTNN